TVAKAAGLMGQKLDFDRPVSSQTGSAARHRDAQPVVIEPVIDRPAVPAGGPAVLGAIVPRAATHDPVAATLVAARIDLGAALRRVGAQAVLAPLADVAVHVVQPKGVGDELADRLGLACRAGLAAVAA